MSKTLHMSERIRLELVELEQVILKIGEGWKRAESSGDNYYLDGVALNLHGFYSGLERIFEVIAVNRNSERIPHSCCSEAEIPLAGLRG